MCLDQCVCVHQIAVQTTHLFSLVLKSMLLHFKSSNEILKHSPVESAAVFQSKPETVMFASRLRGLWYSTMTYLNPPKGMEEETK